LAKDLAVCRRLSLWWVPVAAGPKLTALRQGRSFPESQKNGYFGQKLAILPVSRIMNKDLD
jgi:hypothetical protein